MKPLMKSNWSWFPGGIDDLFTLAEVLFQYLKLRPGLKSKAARGYALWQKNSAVAGDITAAKKVFNADEC